MARVWMRTIKNHKIAESRTIECGFESAPDALNELLREADISQPIWLDKHLRDWAKFQRTYFLPEHFMESVSFDRLEIEYLPDDGVTRKSRDPRNDFSQY